MKCLMIFLVWLIGLSNSACISNSVSITNRAVPSPTPPVQIVEGPRSRPTSTDSERTIDEIIRATPPDLMKRQGCEPVDESDITVSKSSLLVRVWVDGTASFGRCGKIVSYQWDFGDGTKKKGRRASHLYTKEGSYSISLFLIDSNGNRTLIPSQYQIIVPVYYSIKGRIIDIEGKGIPDVIVQINGHSGKPLITDLTGNFRLSKADSGNDYIFTPVKPGYRFSPPIQRMTELNKIAHFIGSTSNEP